MKLKSRTEGCTKWDRRKSEDILEELQMLPILDYITQYQNT